MLYEYLYGADELRYTASEVMAYVFAAKAHGQTNQRRKGNDLPYITHPARIAYRAKTLGMGERAVIVSLTHDVVEDTPYNLADIERLFGQEVSDAVSYLTEPERLEGQTRKERLSLYNTLLARAPGWVQDIKMLDMMDNVSDIVEVDPKFAPTYLMEKRNALQMLTGANEGLRQELSDMIEDRLTRLVAHSVKAA